MNTMSTTLRGILQFLLFLAVVGMAALGLFLYGSSLYNLLPVPTPLPTLTVEATNTQPPTEAPAPTDTPLPAPSEALESTSAPTETPQDGFVFPEGIVNVANGFCRYGPSTAYLHSHGLAAGDHVIIGGRNIYGGWLLVKPDNLDRYCWAAQSLFDITGDISTVIVQDVRLPITTFANPPTGVQASRDGNQVTVSWASASYIPPEDVRGYLLEVFLCQVGNYFWQAIQTDNTQITLQDDNDCSQASMGQLRIAEKHGYTDPVQIPWP